MRGSTVHGGAFWPNKANAPSSTITASWRIRIGASRSARCASFRCANCARAARPPTSRQQLRLVALLARLELGAEIGALFAAERYQPAAERLLLALVTQEAGGKAVCS